MTEEASVTPINTGLAEKTRQKMEAEKARLRSLMPSAASIVEAKAPVSSQQLNEVPNTSEYPKAKSTGLAEKTRLRIEEEKKKLKSLMPSAKLEEASWCGTKQEQKAVSTENKEKPTWCGTPGLVDEDVFAFYEDIEKEFGNFINTDVQSKKIIKEKASNEGKQKSIQISELNSLLFNVQKQLRIKESAELEHLANTLSNTIAETVLSNAKSYDYNNFCKFVNKFVEITEGKTNE